MISPDSYLSQGLDGDLKGLVVDKTAACHVVQDIPEEIDVAGLANDVKHLVEGDRGVGEVGECLGELVESVDGAP